MSDSDVHGVATSSWRSAPKFIGVTPCAEHSTALGIPKRCQPIMSVIQNLSPADFPNQQGFQNALRALMTQLHACEQRYGK